MLKKVLIVDDDRILRSLIQKKFEKQKDFFSTLTAENGLDAVKKLKNNVISLVATDIVMPQMDGFALLAHLSEHYPDIPVIIFTGHSTPRSKKAVLDRGAAGYIEKPFEIEKLAQKIIETLKKESEGGMLQTIPLEMFIQLIEMEQKTCTIRVTDKSSDRQGVLFFRNGDLLDARIQEMQGESAAYEIFSWDNVTLSIQDDCALKEKRIDGDLQAILFEAMRLKDEAGEDEESFKEPEETQDGEFDPFDTDEFGNKESEPQGLSRLDMVRNKLAETKIKVAEHIYQDNSWNDLISQVEWLGNLFDSGALKSCFIAKGESTDFILLPDVETVVVPVSSNCPRDKILRVLSD
jgi:CheY-like chemotaxis protein